MKHFYRRIVSNLNFFARVFLFYKSSSDAMINEETLGWDTGRMAKVDLTIIRLAIYEIKFDDQVPTGVAINEAVELAKKFGQDGSAAFVNGVLAKFA